MQSNERMASRNTALVCGCLPAKLLTLWSTQHPDTTGQSWAAYKSWVASPWQSVFVWKWYNMSKSLWQNIRSQRASLYVTKTQKIHNNKTAINKWIIQNNAWWLRHGAGYRITLNGMIKHFICHYHHHPWHRQVKEIRQALYQTVAFSWILKGKWKVLHHLSTPALETLCLFARLLFRHFAANLAYYLGTTLV